jgi:hypothetical protein
MLACCCDYLKCAGISTALSILAGLVVFGLGLYFGHSIIGAFHWGRRAALGVSEAGLRTCLAILLYCRAKAAYKYLGAQEGPGGGCITPIEDDFLNRGRYFN